MLARLKGDLSRRSLLDPLIERGLVTRQRRIVEPPLRPKSGKQAALLANQETIDQTLPTLGRRPSRLTCWPGWPPPQPRPPWPRSARRLAVRLRPCAAWSSSGWVRIDADTTVTLVIPADEVRERLIELRGGQKYRRVLEALAGEEEPVWVGWLYAEASADLATLRELAAAGLISLSETEVWRDPLAGKEFVADKPPGADG